MFEFERASDLISLRRAWERVSAKGNRTAGIDRIDLDYYRYTIAENLEKLHYALTSHQYAPYPEKTYQTRDRRIFISCLEDKIVQTAVAGVLQEIISFPASVCGYIKNRSVDTAHAFLQNAINRGIVAYYKADIKKFYENIDKDLLLRMLRKIVNDKRFIDLIRLFLTQHTNGISTGSCLSPILSNVYLLEFDRKFESKFPVYLRYADDMLIAPTQREGMDDVINDTDDALTALRLKSNSEKSNIVNAVEGFRYLGFDIKTNSHENRIENLIMSGDYTRAEQLLQQQPVEHLQSAEAYEDAKDYSKYIQLFVRDTDHYYLSADSQNRYVRQDGKLDNALLNRLVGAHEEFAVPALNRSGLCGFAVFDIDINRKTILEQGDDGKVFDTLMDKALETAIQIHNTISKLNIHSYIEFSGYKGYHVWVFWEKEISLSMQKTFFSNILADMDIPDGLHVEKFPISASADEKIKLPLSCHSVHGKDAAFITEDIGQESFIETILSSAYQDIKEVRETPGEGALVCPNDASEIPSQIKAVYEKCHIVKQIVDKAKNEHYIGYHERRTMLHIFHCLGEDGAAYMHHVMGFCIDYDYAVTQKYIDACTCDFPIGCKKITERFDGVIDKSKCNCNFHNADMYPSPVIHAKRISPDCYKMPKRNDRIGHFKNASAQERINDSIMRLIELNKKEYEIRNQKKICNGQIENLFSKNAITEMQTPEGLLIKTEDGLFLRIGD
jgi:retron-type reverse transcriptase